MNRGRYFSSKTTSRRPIDEDGWFETDGMDHLAREVFEKEIPDSYDTGVLDAKGNPIFRELYKNGIGFSAEVWWEENE